MICLQLLEKFKTNCQNQSDYSHLLYLFIIKNLKAIEIYKRHLVSSKLEFFLQNNVLRFCTHFLSREIYMNLLSFCKHTIVSLIVSQIHMEFTMTSLSFSLNPYKYTFFLPNSLWIHYLFTEFTMGPIFTMDPLSFCEFSINSLHFSRTYIKFTIINAN